MSILISINDDGESGKVQPGHVIMVTEVLEEWTFACAKQTRGKKIIINDVHGGD